MNPITSYSDFMTYMWHNYSHSTLVPILLIKPSSILVLNETHHLQRALDCMFDHFDYLTGDRLIYFLPGYAHRPGSGFMELFYNHRSLRESDSIIEIRRLGKIYYNNEYFTDFIEQLSNSASTFNYYGAAELLLVKYIVTTNREKKGFDYSDIHRYNLSNILTQRGTIEHVLHFLEMVVETMCRKINRKANKKIICNEADMDDILTVIDYIYRGIIND